MDDFSDLQPHLRRTTSDPDFESDPVPLPPEPEVDADSDGGARGPCKTVTGVTADTHRAGFDPRGATSRARHAA